MAQIKAFNGLKFNTNNAGDIKELVCPPYDIISEQQRAEYLKRNPYNVIRLELPKEGNDPYVKAGEILKQWQKNKILQCDEKPALYIYEEEFIAYGKTYKVKGFICLVKITPFEEGVVLPHEFTLSKAKTDRFNLMKATFCNFSQIYSLYMDNGNTRSKIDKLSKSTPEIEFKDDDNIIHRMWTVTDQVQIQSICSDFADRKLYIADGHHRYETALNFRNYLREQGIATEGHPSDYVMMMLVDMEHPGLVVFPTHRIVRNLETFNSNEVIAKCEKYFDIIHYDNLDNMQSKLDEMYNKGKKSFGYYDGGKGWTLLTLKDINVVRELLPELSPASQGLDVTVLHSLILERIFGINKENMAKQINLAYIKNKDDAINSVKDGDAQCAFIMNPTRVTEIRDVAAAGEKMPQKSTYFYPKLITGLVMNKICDPEL